MFGVINQSMQLVGAVTDTFSPPIADHYLKCHLLTAKVALGKSRLRFSQVKLAIKHMASSPYFNNKYIPLEKRNYSQWKIHTFSTTSVVPETSCVLFLSSSTRAWMRQLCSSAYKQIANNKSAITFQCFLIYQLQ